MLQRTTPVTDCTVCGRRGAGAGTGSTSATMAIDDASETGGRQTAGPLAMR
jgi:hypothetical protein